MFSYNPGVIYIVLSSPDNSQLTLLTHLLDSVCPGIEELDMKN